MLCLFLFSFVPRKVSSVKCAMTTKSSILLTLKRTTRYVNNEPQQEAVNNLIFLSFSASNAVHSSIAPVNHPKAAVPSVSE